MSIFDMRLLKIKKIEELYILRNTQEYIANAFGMDINHVGIVLMSLNYSYTRKVSFDNLREGELINPIIDLKDFDFLDQYDF